jgi:predicted transcriptional regulator
LNNIQIGEFDPKIEITSSTQDNGKSIMTPQLESLMKQAIQLDRDERLELITHLANSLHSTENYNSDIVLTDLQRDRLEQLQVHLDEGLEDVKAGRILDGETVFANLQQRVERHRELK